MRRGITTLITDARRPLFRLPSSDAVELTDTPVIADKLEADADTAQLTLSVDGHLVLAALIRRRIQLLVDRQTIAVHRCIHTSSTNSVTRNLFSGCFSQPFRPFPSFVFHPFLPHSSVFPHLEEASQI